MSASAPSSPKAGAGAQPEASASAAPKQSLSDKLKERRAERLLVEEEMKLSRARKRKDTGVVDVAVIHIAHREEPYMIVVQIDALPEGGLDALKKYVDEVSAWNTDDDAGYPMAVEQAGRLIELDGSCNEIKWDGDERIVYMSSVTYED